MQVFKNTAITRTDAFTSVNDKSNEWFLYLLYIFIFYIYLIM
jgi:hypothetical protein